MARKKSLLRLKGNGWEVYHSSIIEERMKKEDNKDFGCEWLEFKSTRGNTAKFCGHNYDDGVSRSIKES